MLEWVRVHKVLGPIVLTLIYIVTTVIFIPGSLLAFGAGWVFKQTYDSLWKALLVGTTSVWLGAWLGSFLAFLLGRFVFKSLSERLAAKYMVTKALDRAIQTEGLKFVFLLRLCAVVPFNVLNYALAMTSISLFDYLVGGIGMLPVVMMDVFIGTTLGSLTEAVKGHNDTGEEGLILTILIFGSIIFITVMVWMTCVVKRYLNQVIKEHQDSDCELNPTLNQTNESI